MSKTYSPARAGLIIPMPDRGNRPLPAEGAILDLTLTYYARLKRDGDIVEIQSKATPARRPNRTKDS